MKVAYNAQDVKHRNAVSWGPNKTQLGKGCSTCPPLGICYNVSCPGPNRCVAGKVLMRILR